MKLPQIKHSADDFQTPAIAIKPLLKYLKKEWLIWECACGLVYSWLKHRQAINF